MTLTAIAIVLTCQLLLVTGQLLLKRGVGHATARHRPGAFALGIACLAGWFFLWVGLMSRWELSKLYPFEGLNPALIAIAAWLMLKERMPAGAWLGLALVCAGATLVAAS